MTGQEFMYITLGGMAILAILLVYLIIKLPQKSEKDIVIDDSNLLNKRDKQEIMNQINEYSKSISKETGEIQSQTNFYNKNIDELKKIIENIEKSHDVNSKDAQKFLENALYDMKNLNNNSEKSKEEILNLFQGNINRIGVIGEKYLENLLLDNNAINVNECYEDEDIIYEMKNEKAEWSFKTQYILDNNSKPDFIIYFLLKTENNDNELKKIIIDSKSINVDLNDIKDAKTYIKAIKTQAQKLSKDDYIESKEYNKKIMFFPYVGLIEQIISEDRESFEKLIKDIYKDNIIFSTSENIMISLKIIKDGFLNNDLQKQLNYEERLIKDSERYEKHIKSFKNELINKIGDKKAKNTPSEFIDEMISKLEKTKTYLIELEKFMEYEDMNKLSDEIEEFEKIKKATLGK